MTPVYFDNCATTKMDPRVIEEMLPFFDLVYGNASSKYHQYGRDAFKAIAQAKTKVAELLGAASPDDVIFTSGATESIHIALGVSANAGNHVLTSSIEHKAVIDACQSLGRFGTQVSYVAPTSDGNVPIDNLIAALKPTTHLISIMAANNETGVINDIEQIAEIAHHQDILFHTDATQYVGKCAPARICALADMISCAGHKIYGPKGVGILVASAAAREQLAQSFSNGFGVPWPRAGTANVPGIVGFAKALELVVNEMDQTISRIAQMGKVLETSIESMPGCQINGKRSRRVQGVTSVTCTGCDLDTLMTELEGYALSPGSACNSALKTVSHVLQAMGLDDRDARSTIRISLGKFTRQEEVSLFCRDFDFALRAVRSLVPLH